MDTYCGADCGACASKETCRGCRATCGAPFGGRCVAAEYIKAGGREAYEAFKGQLLGEINALLAAEGLPAAGGLYELPGSFVDLAYPMPSGESVKLLDEKNIYLGTQIELTDLGVCCGAVADTTFILLSTYRAGGEAPELVLYKRR